MTGVPTGTVGTDAPGPMDTNATVFYRARADGIWTPTYVSPRIATLTGDLPHQWLADPDLWLSRVNPEDREAVISSRNRAAQVGGHFETRYRLRTRGGRDRPVIDQGEVLDDGGPVVHGVLTARATRDTRTAESIQVLVHDLRSPLAAAAGLVQTLLRPDMSLDPESIRDLLGAADRSLANLGTIASSALALENVHSEMRRTRTEATDVVELVRDVVDHLDDPDDVTFSPRGVHLRVGAHPGALRQAVRCLIDNATGHTPLGTAVTVGVAPLGRAVLITVDDEGPGIPPEYREVVFEPLERGVSPQTRGGLGLGLAVVHQVTAAHGGVAWVEDSPTGGASFRILLPGLH